MTAPWLEIIRARLKYLKAHPSSRIVTASNIQDLLEAIEKKDGAILAILSRNSIFGADAKVGIDAINFDPTKGSEK